MHYNRLFPENLSSEKVLLGGQYSFSLQMGDEFPRRLCYPLPPVTAVLYYRWLAAGLHDKIISQGIGGHRVYVGIRHPLQMNWPEAFTA